MPPTTFHGNEKQPLTWGFFALLLYILNVGFPLQKLCKPSFGVELNTSRLLECWCLPHIFRKINNCPSVDTPVLKKDWDTTIWVFPKMVVPPNHPFNRVFHYKLSILGYPYFWISTHIPKALAWPFCSIAWGQSSFRNLPVRRVEAKKKMDL